MANLKQNIFYDYAHLSLNPHEIYDEKGWKEKFLNGQFNKYNGLLHMFVGDCVLEMHGIKIPPSRVKDLSSEKEIINSARRLLGNFENNLEKCIGLAQKGIIQSNLDFTPYGLYDYSKADKLEGKRVTNWIRQAKDYSSDAKSYFPDDIKLPKGLAIEFVPTFQVLRGIDNLGMQNKEGGHIIEGTTFAKRIENFLIMYDAVVAHINWTEQTRKEIIFNQRKNNENRRIRTIPVAELVLPCS